MSQFPQLQCDIDDSPGPVDYSAEFAAQPGLLFPVGITLDGDVLQLYAGDAYHQDFFPAEDAAVASEVETYLRGLLSGECRIVEQRRGGRPAHAARLEHRVDERWVVRSRWCRTHIPFLSCAPRTLHNI
jgi:hypothetical protein